MTDAQIIAYYAGLLAKYGQSYRAGDYGSAESQTARLTVLAETLDDETRPLTVLDVGCGTGDFRAYVPKGIAYTGWDFSPTLIGAAAATPGGTLVIRDLMTSVETGAYDYVVASGLFQFRGLTYLKKAVTRMYALCRIGVAFNVLTKTSVPQEIVQDPFTIARWCRTIAPYLIVRADYRPNDATLYLSK